MKKLTEEEKNMWKRAYNRKRFTKELYSKIMAENVLVVEKKLEKIGWQIMIRKIGGEKWVKLS